MNLIRSFALGFLPLFFMLGLTLLAYFGVLENFGVQQDNSIFLHMPAIYLVMLMGTFLSLRLSPDKYSMPNSRKALSNIMFGTGLILTSNHFAILTGPHSYEERIGNFVSWGIALALIVIGNVLGKTERNFYMSVILPRANASEANWKATHRFAGKIMVISGIALLVTTYFTNSLYFVYALGSAPFVFSIFYSAGFAKKEQSVST